jgi:hypothetical protein
MRRSTQIVLLGVLALLVASIVVGAVLVSVHGSGSASPVVTNVISASGSFTPPRGAVVVARESGSRAVALAVGHGRLTATVLAGSGEPDTGLPVLFRVGGRTVKASSCGDGCYTAAAPAAQRVDVLLGSGAPVSFDVPAHSRPADAIVRRASRVFRGLRSLVYTESLRSSPKVGLLTTWKMQAPDQVSYKISNGASAVVIGNRRWDRSKPSAKWVESEQAPKLQVPAPTWGNLAVNAHVLGTATIAGRAVWVVSFVNPSVPAWFTAWIDRGNYRTLRLRMTAASHFMFHRYVAFDRKLAITPPG